VGTDRQITFEELSALVTPDKLGVIGSFKSLRLGCGLFAVLLEHRHFSPRDRALNDQYEFHLVPAPDDLLFYLILVPGQYRETVDAVAQECRLRLVDGVPHIFGGGAVWDFPVNKPNVFTLENLEGSFVYMNNQKLLEAAFRVEQEKIDAVFAEFETNGCLQK
jgi:hypothetical protein